MDHEGGESSRPATAISSSQPLVFLLPTLEVSSWFQLDKSRLNPVKHEIFIETTYTLFRLTLNIFQGSVLSLISIDTPTANPSP